MRSARACMSYFAGWHGEPGACSCRQKLFAQQRRWRNGASGMGSQFMPLQNDRETRIALPQRACDARFSAGRSPAADLLGAFIAASRA